MVTESNTHPRAITAVIRSFSEHPASVNETYFEHLLFAFKFSAKLMLASMAALTHALVPAMCETTASRLVGEMHASMQNRHK